ncbi:MAG: aconitate hydratase [Pyrinomonadaceae bacterium]
MSRNTLNTLKEFTISGSKKGKFYSLPALEKKLGANISRLPVSIRIVLESVLRNCDGKKVTEEHVKQLANWAPKAPRVDEIPFVVARVVLQDFTGVPLLADLAAMRNVAADMGRNAKTIEPLVPVDLVIDHSVQVDYWSTPDALRLNMETEFRRNRSRYQFLKWGTQAFQSFRVVPPGIGIVHQVNIVYLARGVLEKDGVYYPDTLVGTDSHTTMVNGIGVVGWGVGGIEAEAAMLGQPVYILTPDVVGVHMKGQLREGVTATDLVLRVTELLRQTKVVGKFVEFFGEGAASIAAFDRCTIGNMAPEYGATMGFFPVDEKTLDYYRATGRTDEQIEAIRNYFVAQGMFGIPREGECDYSQVVELDLSAIQPSVAGPKRPQDRIELQSLKDRFLDLLKKPVNENGYDKQSEVGERFHVDLGADARAAALAHTSAPGEKIAGGGEQDPTTMPDAVDNFTSQHDTNPLTEREMMQNRPTPDRVAYQGAEAAQAAQDGGGGQTELGHGDVVIAAITSCTNTSNPSVMLGAGLLAKKAVERGLKVPPTVKPSLGPGSRVVTDYLDRTGLQPYLDQLGFNVVGYGCTTCIGNSGPLDPRIESVINEHDIVTASVLSGNRNFEARVHQSVRANFLMSPPLVVAFALAGRVGIDMTREPLGQGRDGEDVYLRDIWPTSEEIGGMMGAATDPETYRRLYSDFAEQNPLWNEIPSVAGEVYEWDQLSTYIQEPPYFERFSMEPGKFSDIKAARPLAIFGDSVTTDHISPAGAIKPTSPAGIYLRLRGVSVEDFNSYGSRRGNHQVMVRGTFANVRIRNQMVPGTEGGVTCLQPVNEKLSIYDASVHYQAAGVPLVVIAGQEYGTGSSRDWAAKGTRLLGVRAVVAQSFERIHRSNLVGMGVLPLQFKEGVNAQTLKLDGTETFCLVGLENADVRPQQDITLHVHRASGEVEEVPVRLRIDTPIEIEYYRHGGILQFVLRQLIAQSE